MWAPERRSRREALLLASTVGASFLAPARSARATEASNLASLASQEPDAEIAVELWDEVVRLAKASGESATPTGGSWLYSRAECLGALRRWTDAERAYGEAADVLETALESTSGKKKDNATALTLALAHDGRSLSLGQLDDWPGAVEASRRALAAGGAAGVTEGGGLDVPTTARRAADGGAEAGLQRGYGEVGRGGRGLRGERVGAAG